MTPIEEIQGALSAAGYDIGKVDGAWGPRSRAALATALSDAAQAKGPKAMKTGDAGVALIKSFEGFVARAYDDFRPTYQLKPGDKVQGTLTIGYGHTGADVTIGTAITEAEGDALLRKDLATAEAAVSAAVVKPLTQNQFDALVGFTFNVGGGAMKGSTLIRKFNAGDISGAAAQFGLWNTSKGKVLAGLTRRRAAERDLFLRG